MGPGSCTAICLVADDVLVTGDAAGVLTTVHLSAQHQVGQTALSSASQLSGSTAVSMQGPGGQPAAPGGILKMGPCMMEGVCPLNTLAASAGTLRDEEVKYTQQVLLYMRY